jgi:hypothetical protein
VLTLALYKNQFMRLLLVLPLALLFLVGCAKSDRDLLNGKWGIHEISANGEKMYTANKAEQGKIVDDLIKKQMAQLPQEMQAQSQMMKDMMMKQMEAMGKTTIEIKEDGTYIATSPKMEGTEETKGKITIDEKKKELSMKSEGENETVKYEFKDDMLIFKITKGAESAQMTFKKM